MWQFRLLLYYAFVMSSSLLYAVIVTAPSSILNLVYCVSWVFSGCIAMGLCFHPEFPLTSPSNQPLFSCGFNLFALWKAT